MTHYEHGPGCTLGPTGNQCDDCKRNYPGGVCRYCREPRPSGYAVTCGRSECQEAAYNDREQRTPRRRKTR